MLTSLGALYCHGYPVDFAKLTVPCRPCD